MIPSTISPDTNYSESDYREVDPILTIQSELDRMFKSLQDYSGKPNANQKHIEIEMEKYKRLRQAANNLSSLRHFQFWCDIERGIYGLLEQDNSLEIITVEITKPGCPNKTQRRGYLPKNYRFSHGKA